MHGKNEIFQMPNFINDYDLWDKYCGTIWSSVISETNISSEGIVIDIAPGASAKIEYALENIDFKGKLYIIEPHKEVGNIILDKSKKILKNADIILIDKPFAQVSIEENVDTILTNHPFDDFISAYLTEEQSALDIMFNDISKEDNTVLRLLNNCWSLPESKIEKTKSKIEADFKNFIEYHQPNNIIFNQYESSYFNKNGLSIINLHAKDLFDRITKNIKILSKDIIQKALDKNENYGNIHIGEELLESRNWTVYEKQ